MKMKIRPALFVIVCIQVIRVQSEGLIALNDSPHALELYRQIRNERAPTEADDPATNDAQMRERICEDITNSGFFYLKGMQPVNMITARQELFQSRHIKIFIRTHTLDSSTNSYEYTNEFRKEPMIYTAYEEHLFVCLVRDVMYGDLIAYYVSKQYNVFPLGHYYMPGRFIYPYYTPFASPSQDYMKLAEEPARAFAQPEFNLELYYLDMRKHVEIAEEKLDPFCKLISNDERDPHNQHYRFCVAVSRSSNFRHTLKYPVNDTFGCELLKVSFRTVETAERIKLEGPYYERMAPCYLERSGLRHSEKVLLISRAYRSNEVLVYNVDMEHQKIYLENLSTNVSIMDEINSFDFVET